MSDPGAIPRHGLLGGDFGHEEATAVVGGQTDQLFRQFVPSAAGVVVATIAMVGLLWTSSVDRTLLFGCMFAIFAVLAGRFGLWHHYTRPRISRPGAVWLKRHARYSVVTGIVWGSCGILLFDPDSLPYQVILAIVLAGVIAGSVAAFSAYLPSVYCFAIPTLTPLAGSFFVQGTSESVVLGIVALVFLGLVLRIAGSWNAILTESLRLKFRNEGLQRATRFYQNLSHELRTPLNPIAGFADLLGKASDRQVLEDAEVIGRTARSLTVLVADILELTRHVAGEDRQQSHSVDLEAAVAEAKAQARDRINGEMPEVRIALPQDLPRVLVEPRALRQALVALIAVACDGAAAAVAVAATRESDRSLTVSVSARAPEAGAAPAGVGGRDPADASRRRQLVRLLADMTGIHAEFSVVDEGRASTGADGSTDMALRFPPSRLLDAAASGPVEAPRP